ncbi:ComEC/Rec2 family competence protein [Herbiconiux sp. YIM B11900]|uniref:ComEC/Rec2 family competence protein n=1 Tax=Herbiconiux sp. YIM B11900 TaxID=3404131 RepID=UPI003F82A1BF
MGRAVGLLPTAALGVAVLALVATAVFGLGHLRHPDVADSGPRVGSARFIVTGLPQVRADGFPPAYPQTPSGATSGAPADATGPAPQTRISLGVALESFTAGDRTVPARAPTVLFATVPAADADVSSWPIGSALVVRGTLTALEPGDSREFLFFARDAPRVLADPPWYLGWASATRDAFRTSTAGLPGDGAELLAGLAIGDDSGVSDGLRQAMTVSGLTHLTAVSGANCAVVVTAVMLLGGAVGLGRRLRIGLSVLVLVLFVVLVTPEPSVLRAAAMAVIVLVALAIGRPSAGVPPLCLSVVVLLTLDPWLGRSAGFALSVLATAGLLLLTRPIAAVIGRVVPASLALALAVPLAAQIACQPVLFAIAPQLTPYTLPANVLAEPAAALVSILGLVLCLLSVAAPGLAGFAAWLPWLPSAWIGAVARFFAGAPFAAIALPDSAVAVVVALLATVLVLVALFAARRHPLVAGVCGAVAACGLLISLAGLGGAALARDAAVPRDWQLAACDIGQGDAVLVHSRDEIALVDVGPEPAPLTACLERMHVQRIDLLVLTHYDRDHVGGIAAVTGRVDRALVGPADGPSDDALLTALRSGGAEVMQARRGLAGELGDYHWDVVWPEGGTDLRGNDASVTVSLTGPLRMLFLGDLGERAQNAVRSVNALPVVDVVKVAHHGSADQSQALYLAVRASVGVISVGLGNRYGHPTDELLAMLALAGTRAFRTDQEGLTVISGTSGAISVWTERPVPP